MRASIRFTVIAAALVCAAPARAQSAGSMLDPTPSAQKPAAFAPVRAPTTPTSLLRKNPFPTPPVAPLAPATRAPAPAPATPPVGAEAVPEIPPAPPGFDPRVCERAGRLTTAQADACRNEFRRRIEADRARIEAKREADRLAREERAARRGPKLKPREAGLDSFFAEDLVYGDVVMTDAGARVYIGRKNAAPRREDFVTLDDPRSPRRDLPAKLKRAPRGL